MMRVIHDNLSEVQGLKRPTVRRATIALLSLLLVSIASVSQAALLTVNLAGVDVRFRGTTTDITDDGAAAFNAAGNTNAALGDPVDAATLKRDNVLLDAWMFPPDIIRADLLIQDGLSSLSANVPTNVPLGAGTNEFVWFVNDGTELRLDFSSLTVQRTVLGSGLPEIFLMTGLATVTDQTLPGGILFEPTVSFAYVSTTTMFFNDNQEGLAMAGVLTITGNQLVPEPSTIAFGCLGAVGAFGMRRSRRQL